MSQAIKNKIKTKLKKMTCLLCKGTGQDPYGKVLEKGRLVEGKVVGRIIVNDVCRMCGGDSYNFVPLIDNDDTLIISAKVDASHGGMIRKSIKLDDITCDKIKAELDKSGTPDKIYENIIKKLKEPDVSELAPEEN